MTTFNLINIERPTNSSLIPQSYNRCLIIMQDKLDDINYEGDICSQTCWYGKQATSVAGFKIYKNRCNRSVVFGVLFINDLRNHMYYMVGQPRIWNDWKILEVFHISPQMTPQNVRLQFGSQYCWKYSDSKQYKIDVLEECLSKFLLITGTKFKFNCSYSPVIVILILPNVCYPGNNYSRGLWVQSSKVLVVSPTSTRLNPCIQRRFRIRSKISYAVPTVLNPE